MLVTLILYSINTVVPFTFLPSISALANVSSPYSFNVLPLLSWITTLFTNLSSLNEKSFNCINPIFISEIFWLFISNMSVEATSCSFPSIVNFFTNALELLSLATPDTLYFDNPYSELL